MDPMELITSIVLVALGADRALDHLSRLGRWPGRLRRLDVERAERMVENREREDALDRIAEKADAILEQVLPNGGKSMRDEVRQLRKILERHIEYATATDAATTARLDLLTRELQALDARSLSSDWK